MSCRNYLDVYEQISCVNATYINLKSILVTWYLVKDGKMITSTTDAD